MKYKNKEVGTTRYAHVRLLFIKYKYNCSIYACFARISNNCHHHLYINESYNIKLLTQFILIKVFLNIIIKQLTELFQY